MPVHLLQCMSVNKTLQTKNQQYLQKLRLGFTCKLITFNKKHFLCEKFDFEGKKINEMSITLSLNPILI